MRARKLERMRMEAKGDGGPPSTACIAWSLTPSQARLEGS